jgi:polar amino acid transport system substrate-binding protein
VEIKKPAGRSWGAVLAIVLGSSALLSACGSSDPDASAGPSAKASTPLVACADLQQPPIEFYEDNKPTGFEYDLAAKIASDDGRKLDVRQMQFNGLIPALLSKQCDVVIGGVYKTDERTAVVDFVLHSKDGQTLMVQKGNPHKITGFDSSLSGARLGMTTGYSTIPGVEAVCKKIATEGSKACSVVLFDSVTNTDLALKTGKVDAVVDSLTSIGYYAKLHGDFEEVTTAEPILSAEVGFAVRKDDAATRTLVQQGVDRLYESGWVCTEKDKWGIGGTALDPHVCS